ncbi:Methyltransferase-like protein 22 [Physocladia obscura]|uniref:Methyltransferase-like protein 22 n=1 Tax=Physocladia obscura TaxID=109957 RepID=A0AAD5SZR8_9FUNG|nr:Methyltransferase-like protein 22 [Physocladia obscura]
MKTQVGTDVVLSDVHVSYSADTTDSEGFVLSEYRIGEATVLRIRHALATQLNDVGMQIWAGAMVLAELILADRADIQICGQHILELGAGTGLVSLCAAVAGAKSVVASDIAENMVLSLLHRNVLENNLAQTVTVRHIDLTDDNCVLFSASDLEPISNLIYEFKFSKLDFELFQSNCSIILAADIVYLDLVTYYLVKRLPQLLLKRNGGWESRTLFLSLEKRVQFSIQECAVTVPAWDFLLKTVKAMNADLTERITDDCADLAPDFPDIQIRMEQVDLTGVPQLFTVYERVKELEVWKFDLIFLNI